jgi:DNA-binding MarR family transcriptional regulator
MSKGRNHQAAALPVEDRTFIALLKAADALTQEAEQVLKGKGLTGVQYNVLRILRGAEPGGLACSTIGERMISHDPDITRLLDRMEKRSLITRQRQSVDRRVVKTRITRSGLEILKRLEKPIRDLHRHQFQHMATARLRTLAELLGEIVQRHGEDEFVRGAK